MTFSFFNWNGRFENKEKIINKQYLINEPILNRSIGNNKYTVSATLTKPNI